MAHEDLTREQHVEGSSNRAFGVVFAALFLVIAAWPLIHGAPPRWWAGAVAAAFGLLAWLKPDLLAALNRQWIRLGLFLGRIAGPVALAVLFYLVFTPLGLLMRMTGKDPLRTRREAGAATYWIGRQPPGPPPGSMTNQF
jgi:hypothetical protein